MKRLSITTDVGRLDLALAHVDHLQAARELAVAHGAGRTKFAGPVRFMDRDAWLKSSFLSGRARLRHGALRMFARAPAARMREAWNASWLEARLFQVPHPLAAGSLGGAAPRWQFLVSEFVAGTALDVVLRASEEMERALLLRELAQETARMHALHFVHRDLFWRNVLVKEANSTRRLVFIDTWRGGERLQWRTAAYDLACLFLEGPSLLRESEIHAWLAVYTHERAALGKPIAGHSLWSAANRARRSLFTRVQREPGRWRVKEAPVQEFDFVDALR